MTLCFCCFILLLDPTPIFQNIKLLPNAKLFQVSQYATSQFCAFDLHMVLSAWNLFYYIVCVCMCLFKILTKHNAENKIMQCLTQVYILNDRNRPSHCRRRCSQYGMTGLWERSQRTGKGHPTIHFQEPGVGRSLISMGAETSITGG